MVLCTGKTSLLRLLASSDWPDDGEIEIRKGINVSYLEQAVELDGELTAIDAVVTSETPVARIVRDYNRLLEQGENVNRQVLAQICSHIVLRHSS